MLRCIILRDSIPLRKIYEENPSHLSYHTIAKRDSFIDRMTLKQKLLAEHGAAGEAFRLVALGHQALVQAAWALLSELCFDGNRAVQDICFTELSGLRDSKCLEIIRDQISVCVTSMMYAAGADLRAQPSKIKTRIFA